MTTTAAKTPVITKSHATWRGEHHFDAGPEGRAVPVDGDSKTAPGPVETLLNALATCSGVDVLDILAKRRTPAARFEVDVTATRRAEAPRRVERLEIVFRIDGGNIAVADAERAIQLSFEKYCSVAASLAPDIATETTLVLNGHREPAQKRTIWRPS
jgi:putative redox protein